jgi:glyoxylase-like metal-dependent hydrolase (beta-lactamase superfamily II)
MTAPIRLELPTGFEFGTVNAYLFTEPEPVLVDTGLKTEVSWTALQAALARNHLTVADITRVIITHPHVDHCGQAGLIMTHSPAEIWIADMGAPWLLDFAARLEDRTAYYRATLLPRLDLPPEVSQWVLVYLSKLTAMVDSVPPDRIKTFQVGDTLPMGGRSWQVLHAPGHASTQTCFYQADTRQFLAADMLLAKAPAPVTEKPTRERASNLPALLQFLDSLTVVEALDIDRVYPGHGDPFTDHRQVIQGQRERITLRKAECLSLIAAGHYTVAALMDKMYGLYPPQFHLPGLWMLLGYLNLLELEGRIERRTVGGVWHYRRVNRE